MHRGYIKFWRAIWDNKYWPTDRPYTKAEAWLDMLLMASYKDTSFEKRGVWVSLKRGQLGRSVKGLAGKWHWSQGKVNRFLNTLKLDKQIEYQKNNITTLITIINYEIYQGDGDQNGDQTETRRRPDGDQTETYNKVKKLKKVNKEKKEYISPLQGEHENVKITSKEHANLFARTGKEKALDLIERLSGYIASKGDKYKSHYATMLNWHRKDPIGASKGTTTTMTPTQEAERNMLKNELSALYDKLESKKQVPEGHPIYDEAQRAIVGINKRIDEIEAQLRELEG